MMGKLRHRSSGRCWRTWPLSRRLGGLGLGLVGSSLIACAPVSKAPLPPASPVATTPQTISPAVAPPNPAIQQKLEGEWRDQTLMHNQQVPSLWFADNGKAYIISDVDGKKIATEAAYRLNTATQPMQIDIAPGTDAPLLGIFEFSADGKLRIDGGEARPAGFSDRATLHQKVSVQTQLPSDIQVMKPETGQSYLSDRVGPAPVPAAEGKSLLKLLNRNQQAIYQLHQRFAGTMAELGISVNSDHYNYMITTRGDRHVIMMAQAKQPQWPSFTSILIAQTPQQMALVMCETAQPTAAMMDEAIANPEKFQCPAGTVPAP